jgi:hypothetical protein
MGTYTKNDWIRPEDEQWGTAVEWRLALVHPAATRGLIEQVLMEAQQACADSGRPATELFDDAESYADPVARDRISEEHRASGDMDGITPAEHLQGVLLGVGFIGVALSILLLITNGFSVETSPWQLVMLATGNLAYAAALAAVLTRRAGQVKRSWSLVAVTVAALGTGAFIAVSVRDLPSLRDLPTLVPLVVYLAILVGAWNLPSPAPRTAAPKELSIEDWFAQLGGLLRGRYYLPRAAATRYVAEARAIWQESGTTHPQAELDVPQVYALQLLDGSPQPHRAQRRFLAWAATTVAAMWTTLTVVYLVTGDAPGDLLWRWFVSAFFVAAAAGAWRRYLRAGRES